MKGRRSNAPGFGFLLWLVGGVLLLWPSTALANPIIPPVAIIWPVAWLALVPVVLVETAVACRVLGWTCGRALRMATVANLFSTLVGVPVGTCLNPVALLGPVDEWWSLPAVVLPLYGVSVVSEVYVADKFMELHVPRRPAWRWALIGNAVSYLLIFAVLALVELSRRSTAAIPP
jgi:hypothetical protein